MRSLLIISVAILVTSCTSVPMIAVYQTNYPHRIQDGVSEERVKESIIEGAKYAGWETRYQASNNILATYKIRVHTVVVSISYTIESYSVTYQSSTSMKMACTQWENNNKKYRISGERNCPDNLPPVSIHGNYKVCVDSLVASINRSLETRQ